ncbi:hypothetical protein BBP40_001163 [Aspergillus hancockii]|nr:hypothetical protein BBP40_001163 [Aspergillus hancockii]
MASSTMEPTVTHLPDNISKRAIFAMLKPDHHTNTTLTKDPESRRIFFMITGEPFGNEGPAQLGKVISSLNSSELVFFDPEWARPPVSPFIQPTETTLKNHRITSATSNSSRSGFCRRPLEISALKPNITESTEQEMEDLKLYTFDPTPEFLTALGKQLGVVSAIRDTPQPPALLVTGVAVASSVKHKSHSTQTSQLGSDFLNVKRIRTTTMTYKDTGPMPVAFSVHELEVQDGRITAKPATESTFSDDCVWIYFDIETDAA